jgi:hypothetical protein
MPSDGRVDRQRSEYPAQPQGARSPLTKSSLDETTGHANRGDDAGLPGGPSATFLCCRGLATAMLVATMCSCTDGDGAATAKLTYPDLRTVPARPVPEDTLAERQSLGNELLQTREEQSYEREELRYRVGLRPSPPNPPTSFPHLSEPEPPKETRPPAPSASLEARYLRQQIEGETSNESLNDFLGKIAERPVDVEPLATGDVFVPEDRGLRSRLFSDTPNPEEAPEYPDWRGYRPLLDRVLGIEADRRS